MINNDVKYSGVPATSILLGFLKLPLAAGPRDGVAGAQEGVLAHSLRGMSNREKGPRK